MNIMASRQAAIRALIVIGVLWLASLMGCCVASVLYWIWR